MQAKTRCHRQIRSLASLLPQALQAAPTRLAGEFDGIYGTETIERSPQTSYGQFATTASIANYLPLLAEALRPVVSAVDWSRGRRAGTGLIARDLGGYVVAQVLGCGRRVRAGEP